MTSLFQSAADILCDRRTRNRTWRALRAGGVPSVRVATPSFCPGSHPSQVPPFLHEMADILEQADAYGMWPEYSHTPSTALLNILNHSSIFFIIRFAYLMSKSHSFLFFYFTLKWIISKQKMKKRIIHKQLEKKLSIFYCCCCYDDDDL